MAAIYSNGGNRWNILGFNFTKRDALSSVYKISMGLAESVSISGVVIDLWSGLNQLDFWRFETALSLKTV
jgi:hypothetical protein